MVLGHQLAKNNLLCCCKQPATEIRHLPRHLDHPASMSNSTSHGIRLMSALMTGVVTSRTCLRRQELRLACASSQAGAFLPLRLLVHLLLGKVDSQLLLLLPHVLQPESDRLKDSTLSFTTRRLQTLYNGFLDEEDT